MFSVLETIRNAAATYARYRKTRDEIAYALAQGIYRINVESEPELQALGAIAADCLARAIGRAIVAAESLGDLPSYRSLHGRALGGGPG